MCWFPFLPRPRGTTYKHHTSSPSSSSSPLLGPAPTSAKHHHHRRVPLPSHHPATSQTSLTPHYQHIYHARAPQPQPRPQQARHTRAVLSGSGVKRAPPRAWDEWDDEALDRRRRRYRPHHNGYDGYGRNVPHGFPFTSAPATGSASQRPRARANSSARRQRPLVDVGNGTSFAARAQRGGRGALDDVLRAAMYDGDVDRNVRVAAPVGGRRRGRRGGGGAGAGEGGFGGCEYGVDVGARRPWPPVGGLEGWM